MFLQEGFGGCLLCFGVVDGGEGGRWQAGAGGGGGGGGLGGGRGGGGGGGGGGDEVTCSKNARFVGSVAM